MNLHALVPIKSFAESKTRLSGILDDRMRAAFARTCVERTLDAVHGTNRIHRVWMISRERTMGSIDGIHAEEILDDKPEWDLNGALEAGRRAALREGAEALIVIPTDLPWLTAHGLEEMLDTLPAPPFLAIAPDRNRTGTNMLIVAPPKEPPFQFGPGSFARHCASAEAAGLPLKTLPNREWGLDVDTPDDLREVLQTLRDGGGFEDFPTWEEAFFHAYRTNA